MKKRAICGVAAAALSTALVASLGVAAAPAFAGAGAVSSNTSWTIPTGQMQGGNTVTVNGKLYKVITTWANAWALSGPDYIGVSNSGTLNQNGGGGSAAALKAAQSSTLLGVWASEANEVPNAYNWNYFWDLYAAEQNYDQSKYADFSAIEVGNGAAASFVEGVYAPFKYRPEIIWTSNSLSATSAAEYSTLIREGKYYATGDDKEAGNAAEASEYYIAGDENYNPSIMSAANGTSFTFSNSLYQLAGLAEDVIKSTAGNNANGAVTASNVTWQTMNALPRTTRYEASAENPLSARECATEFEKVVKGSVYYTLSKINDGTVAKKKVAWLTSDPDTTGDTATVAVFDGVDTIGQGADNGYASIAPMTTTQLGEDKNPSTGTVNEQNKANGVSYVTYQVTCDELASCDYIMLTSGGGTNGASGLTPESLKAWVVANASSAKLKASAQAAQYATTAPAMMNAHNFTIEKTLFGLYNLCFIYPELYPNMELIAYYYDNVYHLKSSALKTALQWGLGNVSLPEGVELANFSKGYSITDMENKFKLGYKYYTAAKNSDAALKAFQGTTGRFTGVTGVDYSAYAPSSDFAAWASGYSVVKSAQSIKVSPTSKTYKATAVKKAKKTFTIKVTGATGKVTYTPSSAAKKAGISVSAKGKVTVKKGTAKGTYKITVKAAATDLLKAASKTVTIKIS